MSRPAAAHSRFVAAPMLYAVLLVLLAWVGSQNQLSFRQQAALLDRKVTLQSTISSLRFDAAQISGPVVIGNWARETGMIPAPQGRLVREIAPQPLPEAVADQPTGLEVITIWR